MRQNIRSCKFPFFSAGPSQIRGSRRRMQRWFESAEGNRAHISPAGKTERQAQQGLRIRGPFYGLLCSLQRVPFKELLHSYIWFQPTPANKTCVASDGKSRSDPVEENVHHLLTICGKRGDVATKDMLSTCFSTISALSLSVFRIIGRGSFCGPNIMLSSLWVCFWFTVHKWRRVRSANILLHGNGMINWTVYKL